MIKTKNYKNKILVNYEDDFSQLFFSLTVMNTGHLLYLFFFFVFPMHIFISVLQRQLCIMN